MLFYRLSQEGKGKRDGSDFTAWNVSGEKILANLSLDA